MESAATSRHGGTPAPPRPTLLCPYCGAATPQGTRCTACRGLLDPLSRQASQNAMGPWFVRDESAPYMPGCSYQTLVGMVKRARVTKRTVLRGPTTRQFWCTAERTPGISHLFGVCHNCRVDVQPTDSFCDECGAGFTVEPDRQHLGLGAVHLLPGQATPESIADAGMAAPEAPGESSDDEPRPRPRPRATPAAEPDLAPLVHALRRRLRKQRIIVLFVLIAAIAALAGAVWVLTPPGSVERWLDERGIRFTPSPAAPPVTAPSQAPPAQPDPSPDASSGASETDLAMPIPATDSAADSSSPPARPAESPDTGPTGPGSEPPPGSGSDAPRTSSGAESPDELERAAAALTDDLELRRALERRAEQLRRRPFP